ncbi:hypothetical protein MANY_14230 [Mycolicibacterium anyangense]|uniref:Uncharacterized protein n=1 Tax=Mycolicibacterium anyangense TaxID=1431246 RepID=A0A6N4W2C4_9MYCO|nr:hypothetical protein MANY_14230 [Mycolicibacterium anyangense]
MDVAGRVAELLGQLLALLVEDVGDHHLGALGDEHPRVSGTHPLRATSDDCNFVVYASHDATGYLSDNSAK